MTLPSLLVDLSSILEKYADLPASVADANLLLMHRSLSQSIIWTTDSHFRIYRMDDATAPEVILPE